MAARFQNIPRIELTTIDDQLVVLGDQNLTESVLIIGPALDGPTDKIIRLNNAADIETIYGPVVFGTNFNGVNGETMGYSGNALMKAVREVQAGGCTDIRLLRVGGVGASGIFTEPAALNAGATGTITFAAKYGGRLYNQVTVVFASGTVSGSVTINQPSNKRGALVLNWSGAASGQTISQLIDRINSHPDNRTVFASVGTINGAAAARLLAGTATMAGGTDGTVNDDLATNKFLLYQNLTAVNNGFDVCADIEVDNVYLAGIYLDDQIDATTTNSVALAFANFLGQRTVDHPMLGFMGVRPNDNPLGGRSAVATHYSALINPVAGSRSTNWNTAGYFMNQGFIYSDANLEAPVDTGAYLQVVAADVQISDPDLGTYVETAAGIYAGTVAALPPQSPATYKAVKGMYALPYTFTRAQLDYLTGGVGRDLTQALQGSSAYVTVITKEGYGTLFTMDVTASQRTSDFKNLQVLRIANAVHKQIKKIAFPYLGNPNDQARRNAMATQIKTYLNSLADNEALLGKENVGYTVAVRGGVNPMDNLLGIVDIDIMLRPALQIKAIRVRVRMSL